MIRLMTILFSAILLAGCFGSTKPPKVEILTVEKIEYIVRIPPKELIELPPQVAKIDVETATQATVAQWIIDNEANNLKLRDQIILISKFLRDEQIKLDKQATEKNSKVVNTPATSAADSKTQAPEQPKIIPR